MALLIKTDGTQTEVAPLNKIFTADELRQHVGCTYFEHVSLADGRSMWLDEDGKHLSKPVNVEATKLLWLAGGAPDDVVAGDVLVTSRGEVD